MSVDVAWFFPWKDKGHGARSAVNGANARLAAAGAKTVVCETFEEVPECQHLIVLGLKARVAERLKRRVSGKVFMQNHSPWLFLECSARDWSRWFTCLAWARETENFVAQVAYREYVSAMQCVGSDGLDLIPAVYPYPIKAAKPHESERKRVVIAHKDRFWKNVLGQLFAAGVANRQVPCSVTLYADPSSKVLSYAEQIAGMFDMPFEMLPFVPQTEFREQVATADLGACCTWSECYSQLALDFLSQGIPILGSSAQWFLRPEWSAFPDNTMEMARVIVSILQQGADAREMALEQARAANGVQTGGMQRWIKKWL